MNAEELKAAAKARMAVVEAEIDVIKAKTAGMRETRDALVAQQAEITARINALTDEINAVEQPNLHVLKMERGALAKMAGGY